jgi:hypothetical protein
VLPPFQQQATQRVVEVEAQGQSLPAEGRRRQHCCPHFQTNGVTLVDTKNPAGASRSSPDQGTDAQAGDDDHQHAHTHSDHVSGNVEFPATIDVVVHENTAENMKKMLPVKGRRSALRPPTCRRGRSSNATTGSACRSGRSRIG